MGADTIITLIRHAQAEHNVALDYSIADAPLTELGRRQAAVIPAFTQEIQSSIDLIASSGLRRTLSTTKIGLAPAIQRLGIRSVAVLPALQECNALPCDAGSDRAVLERDPEFNDFDLQHLVPGWNSKQGVYAADPRSLRARAQWVRQWLRSRPERHIAVVAHGDILRYIMSYGDQYIEYPWQNAEVRQFRFDPTLINTPECPIIPLQNVGAAGAAEPTSGQIYLERQESQRNAVPLELPSLDFGSGGDLMFDIEARFSEKASAVREREDELRQLEARLQAAEKRRAELAAKGITE
ncbi:hypothetical protein OC834_003036 [Tilletia horrida]|uniref:Phosphoglycerate mutase-like protein n=1 Tax=Tilletia horrida TaxID=155126 RepID=A0AAN6JJJ3_9BASI|nr:hypothetical protein OC842_004804 [Tilletia horrida]KAK0531225.1 hypothetical protein OC834_003036 [Tilletia horrida]KAK0532042.1 hypothetical protein OC835_003468 [Tilletia horrida]KAK0560604.1 hypothetical protein OC844_003658 [Tilletia horrida]